MNGGTSPRARLVIGYDAMSPSLLQLTSGAAGALDLIWLADMSDPSVAADQRALARFGIVVDTAGRTANEAAHELARHRPSGLAAFNDSQIRILADVADRLGLPFHDRPTAERLTDKYLQRQALEAAGVPSPAFWNVPRGLTAQSVAELCDQVTFPAVLKPRRGSYSRHTYRVDSREQLRALLDPDAGQAVATSEAFLVEQYLAGQPGDRSTGFADYVSVESLSYCGTYLPVAVTGRFPLGDPFRESGNFVPSHLDPQRAAEVVDVAHRAARAVGLVHGAAHIEVKLTADGPQVLEVNGRLGGGGIADLVTMVTGTSMLTTTMRLAVGEPPAPFAAPPVGRVAYQYFHLVPRSARTVHRIEGVEDVRSWPGVEDVSVRLRPGDEVDWREGSGTFVCSVRGFAPNHEDVRQIPHRVEEAMRLEYASR